MTTPVAVPLSCRLRAGRISTKDAGISSASGGTFTVPMFGSVVDAGVVTPAALLGGRPAVRCRVCGKPRRADRPHAHERNAAAALVKSATVVEHTLARWKPELHPRDRVGRFAHEDERLAALHAHVVDYKPDRSLANPDDVAQIDSLLPNARHADYVRMPFLDSMHKMMGVADPLAISTDDYMKRRDALFQSLPVSRVPFDKIVVTQRAVNRERVQQIRDDPATGGSKPQFFVRHGDETYVINGHHRVAAQVLNGEDARGHVLNLDTPVARVAAHTARR
jgi:hypothetical protein